MRHGVWGRDPYRRGRGRQRLVRLRAKARHVFLVDLDAGAADDGAVTVDVPAAGRVDRAAAEGAHPATRVERSLVLLVGRLEHDGAAAVAGEVHDGGQLVSEALEGRDLRVGRRGAGVADQAVVPVHSVADEPRPLEDGRIGGVKQRRGRLAHCTNGPLGDAVEVVIVWSARVVVEARVGPKLVERVRGELALAVAHDRADGGARKRLVVGVEAGADDRVELGHDALDGIERLGLVAQALREDVASVFVNGDERVLVAAVRARELFEVDVQGAGLGARLATTGVRGGLDASGRAVEARGLDRGAEVLGAVLGRVHARLDLVDAAVIAPMHQRADLHPGELGEVGGRADLVEAE